MGELVVVLTTVGNEADASRIAQSLVAGRLAACVNIVPGVRSIYAWEQQIHDEQELLLLIKSSAAREPELRAALLEMHPYETPEYLVLAPSDAEERYAEWVRNSTTCGE